MSVSKSLRELLVEELLDLHSVESQLLRALPRMAKAAEHDGLRECFETHFRQTQAHVDRLERSLRILGGPSRGKTCLAMRGLLAEGSEALEGDEPGPVRDAQLIGAAQRVEHYEIAAYGTARAFADTLGETKIAELLQQTLDEERDTDQKLTALAETINEEARTGGEVLEEL